MNDCHSSDQNDKQIHAEIDKLFHLGSTSLLALKIICCVVVILFDMAMFVSIIRQSLRRQQNARNGNDQMFVIGIFFLSFSYSLVILLTILELVYFETFPMEFVCQSYFIIVVMPHVILWMNIQVR
jgi:hypothetical protein